MRVLVTGHNGYIGSVMAPLLKVLGHEVVGVDTFYFEDCTFAQGPDWIPSLRRDIRDLEVTDLEGFEAVVHLAALCDDPRGDLNADWTHDINHVAAVRLAERARDAGVQRFLYASSCSAYGGGGEEALSEDSPLKPLTPDAVSKVRTEERVSKLGDASFSPVFMRNATAYGLSPQLRADVVLNHLVCWAHTTGRIRILGDGTLWRPIVHVQDIARAFAAALVAPRTAVHNQAFNVGSNGENYQLMELAEIVRSTVPGCRVEVAPGAGPDSWSYRVDFSKLGRLLPDFRPQWNASFGAKDLYGALQEVALSFADFQGRKYIRLTQLKHLLDTGRLDARLRWTAGEPGPERLPAPAGR